MSRTVFILGAGASALAGAPLMGTLMSSAIELSRSELLDSDDKAAFELVFRARTQLQSVYSKATLNINNVESLFGTFEMAALLGRIGSLTQEEITNLPAGVIKLIARTIEKRVKYPVSGSLQAPHVLPPPPYKEFCELLSRLRKTGRGADAAAVITFNYDIAIDYALQFVGIPFDYCLDDKASSGLHLLKLHGSLNWSRCRGGCGKPVPLDVRKFTLRFGPSFATESIAIEITRGLPSESHCGAPLSNGPVLVPPTWNKGRYHNELSNVWRTAAAHLSQAENIFIIGYSLPDTDEFFRYFYALGSVGETILRRFWIIDPDPEVAERFRRVLGANALAVDCFSSIKQPFINAIPIIAKELGV